MDTGLCSNLSNVLQSKLSFRKDLVMLFIPQWLRIKSQTPLYSSRHTSIHISTVVRQVVLLYFIETSWVPNVPLLSRSDGYCRLAHSTFTVPPFFCLETLESKSNNLQTLSPREEYLPVGRAGSLGCRNKSGSSLHPLTSLVLLSSKAAKA